MTIALLTAGGAGYPLGYRVWGRLVAHVGLDREKAITEWPVWFPFGGARIVAVRRPAGLAALRTLRR